MKKLKSVVIKNNMKAKALILGAVLSLGILNSSCNHQKLDDKLAEPFFSQDTTEQTQTMEEMLKDEQTVDHTAELAAKSDEELEYILYGVTSVFEDSATRGGFAAIGRTDVLNVGLIQLNVTENAQTLNEAVQYLLKTHPTASKNALGADYAVINNLFLNESPHSIQTFFASTANYKKYSPVLANFLGKTQEGVNYQMEDINKRLTRAQEICDKHDLTSVRALSYAFDKVVKYGSVGAGRIFDSLDKIDRSKIDLKKCYSDYFYPKYERLYKGTDKEEYLNSKYDFINNLYKTDPKLLLDYYLLNKLNDTKPDPRGCAILGLYGQKTEKGWEQGSYVNGKFFVPDTAIMDRPITRLPLQNQTSKTNAQTNERDR